MEGQDYYPTKKTNPKSDNAAIELFGNRIFSDQSLNEYLIEFLLVFSSQKSKDDLTYKMSFHSLESDKASYFVNPRIGLRRFIFYDKSKRDSRMTIDGEAYNEIYNLIKSKIQTTNQNQATLAVEAIQDLLFGYSAVLKNRSWTAQSLIPIAPELIFPEAMLNRRERLQIQRNSLDFKKKVDTSFSFDKHNFMARGGEIYYLHLLQGIEQFPETREKLEALIRNLLTSKSNKFSNLANWIQTLWEEEQGFENAELVIEKHLGYIPINGYINCALFSINELITFLSNEMQPIIKLELLAKGIVLQIMRMMCERAREYTDSKIGYCWIIDMRSTEVKNKSVKKISMKSYQRTEELFAEALNKMISSKEDDRSTANQHYAFDSFSKGKKHTLNMFKRLGKEMQLIIPQKGIGERFSMPEDIAKFLVLSLIKPNEKITFNLFLEKLYNNYKIIIGPKEYSEQACASGYDLDQSNYFDENAKEFQNFLKKAGFLRDLSDATSIVVNPYKVVETK